MPITVDTVIPPDPQRRHYAKGWRPGLETATAGDAIQKMDPLGFPFGNYDDFGRYRTLESLEHPDNLIKEAKARETNEFKDSLAIYQDLAS